MTPITKLNQHYTIALLLVLLIACASIPQRVYAQSIPIDDIKDSQYRNLQLLSDSTIQDPLTNRTIWMPAYKDLIKQFSSTSDAWWAQPITGPETKFWDFFKAGIYQPVFRNTYNTALPYGGNNGSAWYGKGLNTELEAGFYLTSKYFTVSLRPHLSYSQNQDFPKPRFIPTDNYGNPKYQAIIGGIDMPYRFGPDSFSTFDWGHSSVSLHYKSIAAGFSTEPLWWGPGIRNALILSNNAPGLKHFFLGTRSPLALPLGIGSLNLKVIWGEPEDSKYFLTTEKTDHRRFTTGANISYTPGFAPNLTLGFIKVAHQYWPDDRLGLNDLTFSLDFINTRQQGGNDQWNNLMGAYFRLVFPKADAELYGEYFTEDGYYNGRDLLMEPDHNRAFTLGFQKIVETDNWLDFFKINGEITSLVPTRVEEVRKEGYYYRHSQIRQGHTNKGQVLGATIGPGSASQFVGVEGYLHKGMLGLFVQRVAVNDFFHYRWNDKKKPNPPVGDIYNHRINLNVGLKGHYDTGPVLLGAKLIWNKNYNYGRYDYGNTDIDFDNTGAHDKVNMQLRLSARYLF